MQYSVLTVSHLLLVPYYNEETVTQRNARQRTTLPNEYRYVAEAIKKVFYVICFRPAVHTVATK